MHAESVLHGTANVWAVALDFQKLFNCISPQVAARVACLLGLDPDYTWSLIKPIVLSKGAWRLPHNTVCPWTHSSRGLPQGLSASVLLAELFVSLLVRRVLICVPSSLITYVDDVNVITHSREHLEAALRIIWEFCHDFSVNLSLDKTYVWGSDFDGLAQIASRWGVSHKTVIEILGVQWATSLHDEPAYEKELNRIHECKERLRRLQHLGGSFLLKVGAASVGCLSLLEYSSMPSEKSSNVSLNVKTALGHRFASPEILFEAFTKGSLDPRLKWMLGCLKMYHYCANHEVGRRTIEGLNLRAKHSRLVAAVKAWGKQGWILNCDSLSALDSTIRMSLPWNQFKPAVIALHKKCAWRDVERRRPRLYAGIQPLDSAKMIKYLKSLLPYSASVMVKIWTGSIMTKAHRATIESSSPMCDCDMEPQTLDHLLYRCPLIDPPTPDILAWADRPPCESVALLCLAGLSDNDHGVWKHVCARAQRVTSKLVIRMENIDWKGHLVTVSSDGAYSYCGKCHVTRQSKDIRHIASRPCLKPDAHPVWEGEYMMCAPHLARLVFHPWKRSALRPRFACVRCDSGWWPSSSPPVVCA